MQLFLQGTWAVLAPQTQNQVRSPMARNRPLYRKPQKRGAKHGKKWQSPSMLGFQLAQCIYELLIDIGAQCRYHLQTSPRGRLYTQQLVVCPEKSKVFFRIPPGLGKDLGLWRRASQLGQELCTLIG